MTAKRGGVKFNDRPPRISVEQNERARLDEQGRWCITWRIHNLEKEAVALRAAHLPHGKFRSEQRIFEKDVIARAAAGVAITLPVTCQEAPDSVVDNAFLILHVEWLQSAWRIFVRLQVMVNEASEPHTRTELITAHKVGFSGQTPPEDCDG